MFSGLWDSMEMLWGSLQHSWGLRGGWRQGHQVGLLTDKWYSHRQVQREEGVSRRTRVSLQREQNERERSDPSGAGKARGRVHMGWAWTMKGRILVPGEEPRALPMEIGKHEVHPGCERSLAWQLLFGSVARPGHSGGGS